LSLTLSEHSAAVMTHEYFRRTQARATALSTRFFRCAKTARTSLPALQRVAGDGMNLFEEFKRRNVFRVGIAYAVASWLLLQVADLMIDNIGAPDWVFRTLLMVLAIGFPITLIMAWAFELTPDGLRRDADVDHSQSIAPRTGRKLDRVIIAMLVAIAAYFIWEARFKADAPAADEIVSAEAAPVSEDPASPGPGQATLDRNAIAVLPFANRSLREEDLFFTDGIHDDLLTQLAKINDLKVISRTSVMAYRDTDQRIPEIAAELGVGIVLEGGVQRAGDRVRINAQLIEVATDQHLWAETFDREMTIDNIFDIQSEISRQIVAAVKGEVSQQDSDSLGSRPTDSLAAWELYLRAEAILRETDYMNEKFVRAEPLVRQALSADPNFAEAWVALVEIQLQGIWGGFADTIEQRAAARESIERAASASPGNPAVLAARAEYEYRVNLDYAASLSLIDEALALAPGEVRYYQNRGLSLRRMGRWEEAIAAFDRALEIDPLGSATAATKAETLTAMNAFDRLEPFVDRWLGLFPESHDLIFWKFRLLIDHYGDVDAAKALLEQAEIRNGSRLLLAFTEVATLDRDWERLVAVENHPENQAFMPIMDRTRDYRLGEAYAIKGDLETAAGHLQAYVDAAAGDRKVGRIARSRQAINLANAYGWLGQPDQAISAARLAVELVPQNVDAMFGSDAELQAIRVIAQAGQRDEALERLALMLDQPGVANRWQIHLDPAWDFFRDDPRFNALIRPQGLEPEPFLTRQTGDST
jgi:TolB-like protein/Tfp pilus assembly protein PilF